MLKRYLLKEGVRWVVSVGFFCIAGTALAQTNDFFSATAQTNSRSTGTAGTCPTCPGFGPTALLEKEQSFSNVGCTAATGVGCTDVKTFSTLGSGSITDNMFGWIGRNDPGPDGTLGNGDDIPTTKCGRPFGSAGLGALDGLNCGTMRFDPASQGQTLPGGTNTAGSFTINPVNIIGAPGTKANPNNASDIVAAQTAPVDCVAKVKNNDPSVPDPSVCYASVFADDFVFNPGASSITSPSALLGVGATTIPSAASSPGRQMGATVCAVPTLGGKARVCSSFTLIQENEGAVGDEATIANFPHVDPKDPTSPIVAGFPSPLSAELNTITSSFDTQGDSGGFTDPTVSWRQRIDQGIFVLDSSGQFIYNANTTFPQATYTTGRTQTDSGVGLSTPSDIRDGTKGFCMPGDGTCPAPTSP